jgi:hypothetical protein
LLLTAVTVALIVGHPLCPRITPPADHDPVDHAPGLRTLTRG